MADTAAIDIVADRRAWFVGSYSFLDEDFTGATFRMQVRATRDVTGTPLLDLANAAAGLTGINMAYAATDTVANHVAAGRLEDGIYKLVNPATGSRYVSGDSVLVSLIIISIADNLLAAMPFPEERGDDATFYYDIILDTPIGAPEILMRGMFTVRAAVTIP